MRLPKLLLFSSLLAVYVAAIPLSYAESALFYLKPINVPADESWLMLKAAPGMEIVGEFALVSQSDFPVDYRFMLMDASHTDEVDGFFALKQAEEAQTSVGLWGELSVTETSLPPSSSESFKVTFTIPEDVELGSYWGGILAMEANPETSEGGITSVIRNGLRVNLEIMSAEDYAALYGADAEPVAAEEAVETDYSPYIFAGVLVLLAALVLSMAKKHEK